MTVKGKGRFSKGKKGSKDSEPGKNIATRGPDLEIGIRREEGQKRPLTFAVVGRSRSNGIIKRRLYQSPLYFARLQGVTFFQ